VGVRFELERRVRALVCDIDGCLVGVGHLTYDLPRLAEVAELNRRSRGDSSIPALTLLTGRPHPYVDAMMQVLDVTTVASFENGAGLATRDPYRAWIVDGIERGVTDVRRFGEVVARRDHLTLQLGKVASATVFPREPTRELGPLMDELQGLVHDHGLDLALDPSNDCVNVLIPGVDKASGFGRLCRALELDEREVAGVGDSVGDVAWLRRCAVSTVPAGAAADVRAAIEHASREHEAAAVVAFYRAVIEANRRL
jgi:hydroxymethylpyrimidine pyrophosphatase-like HAD family hydrolase